VVSQPTIVFPQLEKEKEPVSNVKLRLVFPQLEKEKEPISNLKLRPALSNSDSSKFKLTEDTTVNNSLKDVPIPVFLQKISPQTLQNLLHTNLSVFRGQHPYLRNISPVLSFLFKLQEVPRVLPPEGPVRHFANR